MIWWITLTRLSSQEVGFCRANLQWLPNIFDSPWCVGLRDIWRRRRTWPSIFGRLNPLTGRSPFRVSEKLDLPDIVVGIHARWSRSSKIRSRKLNVPMHARCLLAICYTLILYVWRIWPASPKLFLNPLRAGVRPIIMIICISKNLQPKYCST